MNELELKVGVQLVLRRLDTLETAEFRISELFQYREQIIVYGETLRHGIRVFRGVRDIKGRPGTWVYIRNESPEHVARLVGLLRGAPIVIVVGVEPSIINVGQTAAPAGIRLHPILQARRIPGLPGYHEGAGKDGMIRKAQKLVDCYWDWREKEHYGPLPGWMRVAMATLVN